MGEQGTLREIALVAELNDLIQLDHDALQAYDLAIAKLQNTDYRRAVESFRRDHDRHIDELSHLVRLYGGVPAQLPHLPTGPFKLALQGLGALAGDRGVVLAFEANERQARDDYLRAASRDHSPDVATTLRRAAGDETRHHAWALEAAEELGVGPDTALGRAEHVVAIAHGGIADVVEGAGKGAMAAAEGVRRAARRGAADSPLGTVLLAVGAGLIVGALLGGRD